MPKARDTHSDKGPHAAYEQLKSLLSEKVSYTGAFGQEENVTVVELLQDIAGVLPKEGNRPPVIAVKVDAPFHERERAKHWQEFLWVTPVTLANLVSDLTSLPLASPVAARAMVVKTVQARNHIMEQLHELAPDIKGGKGLMRGIPENVVYDAKDAQKCYYSMLQALDRVYDRIGQIAAEAGITRATGYSR